MKRNLVLFCTAVGFAAMPANAQSTTFDMVVYGGTAGGVITAVSGARMGLKIALLEPRRHIGGMVSGGLSHTDVGKREVIGGYSLEFYWRAGNDYDMPQYLQNIAWYHEPKVAETIFREMLREARVTVCRAAACARRTACANTGRALDAIAMENGDAVHRQNLRRLPPMKAT